MPSGRQLLGTGWAPWRGRGCLTPFQCIPSNAPPPLCDLPLGRGFFTGPWTVTRSSLRMLRRVAAFCRPLRPGAPAVVVSVLAEPSAWRAGGCAGCGGCCFTVFAATPLHVQVVHHMSHDVSVCVRPHCPPPPPPPAAPPPSNRTSHPGAPLTQPKHARAHRGSE